MPKCPQNCTKPNCVFFRKAEVPAAVANDDITPPQNGDFCNMLVVYNATGNAYLFASDGIPTLLSSNDYRKLNNLPSINGVTIIGDLTLSDIGVTQLIEEEADARRDADNDLQEQINTIAAGSDVVDVVGTYQELMQYDTSHLTINDVIKVLDDETENDATTYYRWTNDGWLFVGQEGPYYTKSQVDELLAGKLDDDALDDYYDKTEADALLADKADVSDLAAKQDKLIAGANITIDQATSTISATVPPFDNYYTKQETYSQTEVDNLIAGVSADIPTKTSDLTNDGATGVSTYVELNQLATVATSGSYNDLTDKPSATSELVEMSYGESNAWAKFIAAYNAHSIVYCRASSQANPASGSQTRKAPMTYVNDADSPTQVEFQYYHSVSPHTDAQQGDQVFIYLLTSANGGTWSVTTRDAFSKVVAGANMTSTYSNGQITLNANQLTVPTKTSDLTNDGADGTSTYVEADQLATVATSGSYNDLLNKPTIPAAQVNSDWNASSGVAQILNKPTLATVATSGSYNDLLNKPNIPTVNNATLTVTQNGTSAGTFTANASSNVTIALTDTTYSAFSGATSSAAGNAGLVPAPAAGDEGKFLQGDGTWAVVQSGPTVVQTTGQSTTDVMSQKAVTDIIGDVETILQTLNSGTGAQP